MISWMAGLSYFMSKKKGTGLGLSVVKDIVEKHKCEIKVKSQVDKGTTFKVVFPAVSRESTQTGGKKWMIWQKQWIRP